MITSNLFSTTSNRISKIEIFENELNVLSESYSRGNLKLVNKKLKEIANFQDSVNSILRIENERVMNNYQMLIENKLNYREYVENKLKEVDNYYDSLALSLYTSKFIKPIFIRRFTSFFKPGIQYFSSTGIYIENASLNPVSLVGVGLCGIVPSKDKCSIIGELNVEVILDTKEGIDPEKYFNQIDKESRETISIYKKTLISEKILLKEIEGDTNPVINYYFQNIVTDLKKSVIVLHPKYKYSITFKNLEYDKYTLLWNGKTLIFRHHGTFDLELPMAITLPS